VISELLAALQRLGRNPPPALVVEPESVLRAIRSAIGSEACSASV